MYELKSECGVFKKSVAHPIKDVFALSCKLKGHLERTLQPMVPELLSQVMCSFSHIVEQTDDLLSGAELCLMLTNSG